jgi:hypothetical protein
VVVAVIDGGVDTAHVDLKANLWRNVKEVAGTARTTTATATWTTCAAGTSSAGATGAP